MKTRELILIIVTFATLALSYLIITESGDRDRLKQVEIDHLKKEIAEQRDSLESVLKVTQDSLYIAYATIRLATKEREEAHARTQKTIKDLQRIVFIQHTDSSRLATLKQLYPTFNP